MPSALPLLGSAVNSFSHWHSILPLPCRCSCLAWFQLVYPDAGRFFWAAAHYCVDGNMREAGRSPLPTSQAMQYQHLQHHHQGNSNARTDLRQMPSGLSAYTTAGGASGFGNDSPCWPPCSPEGHVQQFQPYSTGAAAAAAHCSPGASHTHAVKITLPSALSSDTPMTPGRRLSGGTRPQADNTMGAAHQSASHGITFNTEFPGPSELGDGRKRKALDVGTSEPSQGLLHTSQYIATHDQTGQCLQPIAAASGTVPEFSTTTTTQKRQRLRTTSSSLGSSQSATAATVTTAGGPAPAHPLHPAATHQAVPQGPTEVSEHRSLPQAIQRGPQHTLAGMPASNLTPRQSPPQASWLAHPRAAHRSPHPMPLLHQLAAVLVQGRHHMRTPRPAPMLTPMFLQQRSHMLPLQSHYPHPHPRQSADKRL